MGRQVDLSRVAVDPRARAMVLHLYEGTLKVLPLERGLTDRTFDVLLTEPVIRDLSFLYVMSSAAARPAPSAGAGGGSLSILGGAGELHAHAPPTLAVLAEDAQGEPRLQVYELDIKERVRADAREGGGL